MAKILNTFFTTLLAVASIVDWLGESVVLYDQSTNKIIPLLALDKI